ncbi:RCC1 domain-containing protein [Kitasatospora viridis]|uniref:Alpha-tubulin suppressor-like RCC1 family protein n=1 Tax=Kitasatospora viridis TaxID=281105 RepID=A0A561UCF7_9ACTN|nr:hypothetical protein [Kitasatospora viridis]TWF97043.1 alpha-tubulin suppressor-like RCC1 family protein [Kitasatospora viridis]
MNAVLTAWGDNTNGQLGDGSTTTQSSPLTVQGLEGVVTVEAGSGHVVALLEDGTAVAWGRNAFGQLGDGSVENQSRPVPVRGLRGIKQIEPGGGHTLFLLDDGTVWAAGAGFFGCLGPKYRAVQPVPVRVEELSGVRQIASGGGHALALLDDGTVWSWGRDDFGQLGDGPGADSRPGRSVQEHNGRSYPNRYVPALVEGLGEVRSIAAGGGHSLAVLADGSLAAWGCNDRGQLGDGTMNHRSSPVKTLELSGVASLACAYHHTLALLEDGTVRAFGVNDRGQLGDGTTTHRTSPVRVLGLRGAKAVVASGGGGDVDPGDMGHSMALLDDGTVWAWGCNDHGELGDGSTDEHQTPVRIPALSDIRHITAGGEVPHFRENPGGGYGLALR